MKNGITKTAAAFVVLYGVTSAAHAIPVTINMTADNILADGGLCSTTACTVGAGWGDLGVLSNESNWHQSDSLTIDLAPGTHYFAWRVVNRSAASASNPAALLAEILWAGNANYSSAAWEVYDQTTGAFIANATSYGENGSANIWTSVHGGAVAGISTNAAWIYTANNFAGADPSAWFRTSITIATVPEPATLSLFGFGIVALGWLRRRRT